MLIEIPASVAELGPMRMCFFGGGYLRLFPYGLIRHMGNRLVQDGNPLMFYIHPREIDPEHPRIPMSYVRRFKSYVNLHTTERKIRNVIRDFSVTTCRDFLFGAEFELLNKAMEPSRASSRQLIAGAISERTRLFDRRPRVA
jgi:hypothetical protein